MVGLSLGQNEEWPAVYLGFALHMLTSAIIGIIYVTISDRITLLRIDDSTVKAFATGVATGAVVWAVLFVPLHYFVIQPTLQNTLLTSPSESQLNMTTATLIQMSEPILYGALFIHIAFGSVLGFMARVARSAGR